jgi:RHS repeat-associated protein
VTTTTWFVGATEIVDKSDGTRDIRRSVDGVVEQVLHVNAGGTLTGTDTRYLLRDHLGSITGFMDGTAIDQEQAFDAWGRRENVGWASYMTVGGSTWNAIMGLTERGFTGHQHVDRLDLIHMNGRTYDPRLGRFMQADIVVQSPSDTQSYNRYSYLTNNPLNGTDPSGYFGTKDLVGTAVYVVASYFVTPAVAGALAGGAQSAAYGGDAAAIVAGAAWGAFSSAAFAGLNGSQTFGWGTVGQYGQHALNIAANSLLGGGIALAQGGNFGHGFISAGVGAVGNGLMNTPGPFQVSDPVARVIASAIVGGTASELSGGKFANGAITAAFIAAAGEPGSGNGDYSEGDGLTYHDSDINDPTGYFNENGDPLIAGLGTDLVAGFGDTLSFGGTAWIRNQLDIGSVDYTSGGYTAGRVVGTLTPGLGAAATLRAGAYLGGTRAFRILNQNRYLRIGPGRIPAGKPFSYGPATHAPSLRIGNGTPSPWNHYDLRIGGY